MGRWSRQLAPAYVSWLRMPKGSHWLDVGCGTGALTEAICVHAEPASVLGCDPSAPFIEYANQNSHHDRASFVVAGSGSLPGHSHGYDCVASLLALNFFPDPTFSVQEMRKLVRPGGVVSACVWDYSGKMEFLRYFWDVAIAEDPNARSQDEGNRFPICRCNSLTDLFLSAGLADVKCEPIEIPTIFRDFQDYWQPLLGGTGPAPAYIASLDNIQRDTFRRKLARSLPQKEGGVIDLVARSWAVRGRVI